MCEWLFMRAIHCFVVILLAATGISAAEVPNLVGDWSGYSRYAFQDQGSAIFWEGDINITISEQRDRLFTGNVTYSENGTVIVEGFVGVIGRDNETLYLAEFDTGYDIGTLVSDDEIVLVYIEDGQLAKACFDTYHRVM
jgi:hypothetical protein